MAISDTITSIENHLTTDYEGLENIGADLTGIDKNIQNIRPVLDTIYTSLPKVTDEGTEVTLTPTKKGRLALIPKGNSSQEGEPTPSTPIPIKSVTGNNNVVVINSDMTQSQNLPLGTIELNKIGEYQDYIYKNNGKWYKHEEIGKVVLTGSEDEGWSVSRTGTANWYYSLIKTTDIIDGTPAEITMCDHYSIVSISTTNTNQGLILTSSFIRIRYGTEDTIPNWETWLSTHNVKIKYVKSTPTDIEITDTTLINQLEEIDKMKSYNGTTIITSTYDNSNAQMIISASALKGE